MTKRKIAFYYLFLKQNDVEFPIQESLNNLLAFLIDKACIERKQDISSEKFAFIDNYTENIQSDCTLLKLLFKSAKHSYRAPLLNKDTVEERENPKTMAEGERMKTHALIKFKEDDAILFLETGNNIMTCSNIVDYLNKTIPHYNAQFSSDDEKIIGRFCFDMIPRDDFREVLDSMSRVTCAEIYVDKRILGSDVLNYSNPSETIKEDVVLSVKAERKKDIKEHMYDIIDKFNNVTSGIRRIRIKGKLSNNNESVIDTNFIIKKEFVEAQQNEDTGEFNTQFMFSQLETLSEDF